RWRVIRPPRRLASRRPDAGVTGNFYPLPRRSSERNVCPDGPPCPSLAIPPMIAALKPRPKRGFLFSAARTASPLSTKLYERTKKAAGAATLNRVECPPQLIGQWFYRGSPCPVLHRCC